MKTVLTIFESPKQHLNSGILILKDFLILVSTSHPIRLPGVQTFLGSFALVSCFELPKQTPNELHFGQILFKMMVHQSVL